MKRALVRHCSALSFLTTVLCALALAPTLASATTLADVQAELDKMVSDPANRAAHAQAAVNLAGSMVDTSKVDGSPAYDATVVGEGGARPSGGKVKVRIGDKALTSAGWLVSTMQHECESHGALADENRWPVANASVGAAEVEAYNYEMLRADTNKLGLASLNELAKRFKRQLARSGWQIGADASLADKTLKLQIPSSGAFTPIELTNQSTAGMSYRYVVHNVPAGVTYDVWTAPYPALTAKGAEGSTATASVTINATPAARPGITEVVIRWFGTFPAGTFKNAEGKASTMTEVFLGDTDPFIELTAPAEPPAPLPPAEDEVGASALSGWAAVLVTGLLAGTAIIMRPRRSTG